MDLQLVDTAIAQFAAGSIQEKSYGCYTSMMRQITKARGPDGNLLPLSFKGYSQFLMLTTTTIGHESARRYLSALRYFYQITATPIDPAEEAQCERVVTTYIKRLPPRPAEKGPLNDERLYQMINMMNLDKGVPAGLREGIVMQYAFGLRGGQVSTLKPNQFHRLHGTEEYLYVGPRAKTQDETAEYEVQEEHWQDPRLTGVVKRILSEFEPNQFMFPGFKTGLVTKAVARAKEMFHWPEHLKWCGTHNIRHGSLADAREAGGYEAVQQRGAHQSETSMQHYAKADDERRQAVPERAAVRRAREENERAIPAVTGGRVVERPVPVYHVRPPGYGGVVAAAAAPRAASASQAAGVMDVHRRVAIYH